MALNGLFLLDKSAERLREELSACIFVDFISHYLCFIIFRCLILALTITVVKLCSHNRFVAGDNYFKGFPRIIVVRQKGKKAK
jgi:hypothetical protein